MQPGGADSTTTLWTAQLIARLLAAGCQHSAALMWCHVQQKVGAFVDACGVCVLAVVDSQAVQRPRTLIGNCGWVVGHKRGVELRALPC